MSPFIALLVVLFFISEVLSRTFTSLDQVSLPRIGTPVPSPNGKTAVVPIYHYDATCNKSSKNLFINYMRSGTLREYTVLDEDLEDDSPVWINDNTIAFTRLNKTSGESHVWIKNTTSLEQCPTQLTNFSQSISGLKYHRESGKLFFYANVPQGGKLHNKSEPITETLNSPRDSAMVYDSLYIRHWDEFMTEKRHNVFVAKLSFNKTTASYYLEGEPENLLKNTDLECPVRPHGDNNDYVFSPDGALLAFVSKKPRKDYAWSTDQNIYVVPINHHHHHPVSLTDDTEGACSRPVFSRDGIFLAWLQMDRPRHESDRRQIIIYHVHDHSKRRIAFHWDRSPSEILWSPCGKYLYAIAEEYGHGKIFKIDIHGVHHHEVELLVDTHTSVGLQWLDDRTLIFSQSSMQSPAEIFTFDVPSKTLTRKSFSTRDALRDIELSSPEEFWFEGAKGDKVMGWILKPKTYSLTTEKASIPVAFLIHGGPEGAWLDDWSWRWNPQIFAGAGYFVVAINFHGSTGYGQAFTDSIQSNWGSLPYNDLMQGLDHVLKTHYQLNPKRIVALGASYGGYMINWINGNTDRFACLVCHDGMFSTISSYYNTEELYFSEYEMNGTPWTNRYAYNVFNPERLVKNWKTPTLVIHGGKDYRVADAEGISTFTALQRLGVKSRLMYFPDENHWVLKPANSLRWNNEMISWINQFTSKENNQTWSLVESPPTLMKPVESLAVLKVQHVEQNKF